MKRSVIIVLHIAYWCLYLALLSVFALIIKRGHEALPGLAMLRFMLAAAVIPAVLGFYTFYTLLFSEYLNKKRISYLFMAGFGISCITTLVGIMLLPVIYGPGVDPNGPLLMANSGHNLGTAMLLPLNAFLNGIVALLMKGFITWYEDLKMKEVRDRKNYEMELALVKSQFNPHFLFNTINNIDVLIEKDATRASAYLNDLSDMLRFMLYETKTEQIALAKELAYIEKYIELQKIRTANASYVQYWQSGEPDGLEVAPMLFIPFIENAFKHAEHKRHGNAIDIRIVITVDTIIFYCENEYNPVAQQKPEYGGLGNELIGRRLALLYPGRHKLETEDADNMYKVKLTIDRYAH